jgi:hypothetical protein
VLVAWRLALLQLAGEEQSVHPLVAAPSACRSPLPPGRPQLPLPQLLQQSAAALDASL